jgi:hypothetical protein
MNWAADIILRHRSITMVGAGEGLT